MENYYKVRQSMQIGDVIAFSGKGRVSQIIKWKTKSEISHVGMVLDVNKELNRVLMIESTSLNNLPDFLNGKLKKGVQIQRLSDRLESYDGNAWWIPILKGFRPRKTCKMSDWLWGKHAQEIPYDTIQAIGAGADLFDWIPGLENEPDFSSLFCSELVAKAYKLAGLFDDELNPSEQTPADIMNYYFLDKPVSLL